MLDLLLHHGHILKCGQRSLGRKWTRQNTYITASECSRAMRKSSSSRWELKALSSRITRM
jgi:hypothetical protein